MKHTTRLALVLFSLAAVSCKITYTPKATGNAGPLGSSQFATDQATVTADAATTTRAQASDTVLATLRANVEAARSANEGNPDGVPKTVVDEELGVAETRMEGVTTDPEELRKAAERRMLIESGRTAEARTAYAQANADAKALAVQFASAKKAEVTAIAARDAARQAERAAREDFTRQLEQNKRDNEAALEAARNQVMRDQVSGLNKAGATCTGAAVLALGLVVWFGGVLALRKVGPFIGLLFLAGLVCFGLAQIVGQKWFKWTILSAVLLGIGIAVWWLYSLYRDGRLKQELEQKAKQLQAVVHDVVPVLDAAYDNASDSVREVLDAKIFNPLSSRMDRTTKEAVKQLRAEASARN